MNDLKLRPLTCPQCGAPGVVREGTRITECERCGTRLCLTEKSHPRYEVAANLNAAQAITAARSWLDTRGQVGLFGRPELVLVPYHEIAGRRVGVFERKVPVRKGVRRYLHGSQGEETIPEYVYEEKQDTKVMVADVHHLTPAARTPWDLKMFQADAARRSATLQSFDLVEAQRHATVYAEEQSPSAVAARRFAEAGVTARGSAEMAATSPRTLFFPFWSIPLQTEAGSFQIVLEAVGGEIVAWRLPEPYPTPSLTWALLAIVGALGLGHALRALLLDTSAIDPVIAFAVGAAATAAAVIKANRPDWSIRSWPEAGTIPRP
ncbi:MAG: hypothetical protein JSU87_16060 [Gemmatimonadota bacterium]|nr:MAG: hypothetical protein JSU87_16060 [Gemmatimonadota bacterium]